VPVAILDSLTISEVVELSVLSDMEAGKNSLRLSSILVSTLARIGFSADFKTNLDASFAEFQVGLSHGFGKALLADKQLARLNESDALRRVPVGAKDPAFFFEFLLQYSQLEVLNFIC
jgi:hypothetical protein